MVRGGSSREGDLTENSLKVSLKDGRDVTYEDCSSGKGEQLGQIETRPRAWEQVQQRLGERTD